RGSRQDVSAARLAWTAAGTAAFPGLGLGGGCPADVGGAAEVLGGVTHGLRGTRQLAGPFAMAGLEVAHGGAIGVAGRIAAVLGLGAGVTPVVLLAKLIVGRHQVAMGISASAGARFFGRRRQTRVGSVKKRRIAHMLDRTSQVMRNNGRLVSQLGI